jgi:hypothetical protein
MRKLWRRVSRIDDVLEVLIFDVMLGTRWGRRATAGLAAVAGLALYLVSGALFTPPASLVLERRDSSPLIDDARWEQPSAELRQSVEALAIEPAHRARIETELARRAPELERARALLLDESWKFAGQPYFGSMRELATLFVARGLLRASIREHDEMAMVDWVTAARVGVAMATRRPRRPTMMEGRLSTKCEMMALGAIRKHVDAGRMGHFQEIVLDQWLGARRRYGRDMATYTAGEREFRERILRQAIERGVAFEPRAALRFRLIQPATRAGRVAFIERVRDELVARDGSRMLETFPSRLDFAVALFSRDRAVECAVREIAAHAGLVALVTSGQVEELDKTVKHIDARCNPLDLDGI